MFKEFPKVKMIRKRSSSTVFARLHNNEQLKYITFGELPVKHTLIYLATHFFTDTVLHNRKTDNDRQIINKQHAAAQIDQHTNQHNKQKQHKS